jgi:hypothetical protein
MAQYFGWSVCQYFDRLSRLDKVVILIPKVYHVHLRAWGNLEPPTLRRYRQRGAMGKAKGGWAPFARHRSRG